MSLSRPKSPSEAHHISLPFPATTNTKADSQASKLALIIQYLNPLYYARIAQSFITSILNSYCAPTSTEHRHIHVIPDASSNVHLDMHLPDPENPSSSFSPLFGMSNENTADSTLRDYQDKQKPHVATSSVLFLQPLPEVAAEDLAKDQAPVNDSLTSECKVECNDMDRKEEAPVSEEGVVKDGSVRAGRGKRKGKRNSKGARSRPK